MVSVEHKPKTYRGRVHWYVANWSTNVADVFKTKLEAVQFAKQHSDSDSEEVVLSVGWFGWKANAGKSIGDYRIIDHREKISDSV